MWARGEGSRRRRSLPSPRHARGKNNFEEVPALLPMTSGPLTRGTVLGLPASDQNINKFSKYVGNRTTFRVLNNTRSVDACCSGKLPEGKSNPIGLVLWYPVRAPPPPPKTHVRAFPALMLMAPPPFPPRPSPVLFFVGGGHRLRGLFVTHRLCCGVLVYASPQAGQDEMKTRCRKKYPMHRVRYSPHSPLPPPRACPIRNPHGFLLLQHA